MTMVNKVNFLLIFGEGVFWVGTRVFGIYAKTSNIILLMENKTREKLIKFPTTLSE